jgi:hypothetical protein
VRNGVAGLEPKQQPDEARLEEAAAMDDERLVRLADTIVVVKRVEALCISIAVRGKA